MIRHAPRHDRIAIDPAVMLGSRSSAVPGSTVEQILRELGAGVIVGRMLAAPPRFAADDIRAAQEFAAD